MADEKDPTKARWYVAVDLLIKSISAVGLIVLGIAGWQLQSNAQKQQDVLRLQQTNEQLYLPPLQALAQIQIAFSLAGSQVDLSASNIANVNYELGWQMRYLLDSLHFPKEFKEDNVSITPLGVYGDRQKPHGGLTVPYKQAAALASELDAAIPIVRDICHKSTTNGLKYVRVAQPPPALYFAYEESVPIPGDEFISIDPANLNTWKLWFPSDGMFVSTLCDTNFELLHQELASGASDISAIIIGQHPDLAEKAVAMRVDTMKTRNELFGPFKTQ